MHDGVAVAVHRSARGDGPGGRRPAVIVGMVVIGIMMTGTVRHRHSRAGRREFRTAQFACRFDPFMVNFWEMEPLKSDGADRGQPSRGLAAHTHGSAEMWEHTM